MRWRGKCSPGTLKGMDETQISFKNVAFLLSAIAHKDTRHKHIHEVKKYSYI